MSFEGQNFSIKIASNEYDKGTIKANIAQIFNVLLEFPNIISETPTIPESVPKISFKFIDNNLNNQTINKVKTGTLETIKTRIPASILGATKNSTYNGIT